jgi:secreted PhoX family phosphatase
VVLAEDGDGERYLVGATSQGKPFAIGRNAFNDGDLTGVTFADDGRTLFANRREPGVTFAITGPWQHIRR